MKCDWVIAPTAAESFFAALPELHPLTAQTLFARSHDTPEKARAFLKGDVGRVDPLSIKDMDRAVERILQAIGNQESIAVYGDYDCDGVTASALLMTTLTALGAQTQVYIPDRFEEGYGLNSAALDTLKARGVTLVITVDCGARASKEATHARTIELDLIITDHHELEGAAIPDAYAVINPRRPDCSYPFKSLAGVGVAFRLAQCLIRAKRPSNLKENDLLDLVAIGTIADLVPLIDNNRLLVKHGLKRIQDSPRLGVRALMQAARIPLHQVDAGKIGFGLAPRLNAAGRLESALGAYQLLMATDPTEAESIAQQLNLRNEERQTMTAQIAKDAERVALGTETPDDGRPATVGNVTSTTRAPALLFAASEAYSAGVIGLAAARLVEKYYCPAIVISIGNNSNNSNNSNNNREARGSCRSVHGFHITEALDQCRDMLLKHGGHAAAAGFTAHAECLPALRDKLQHIAAQQQPSAGWQRTLRIDAEHPLDRVNWKALHELAQLEPHGMHHARPSFVSRKIVLTGAQRMGKAEPSQPAPHLKLRLRDAQGQAWDAIGWRMGERLDELKVGQAIDLAFHVEATQWNGEERLQLQLLDFKA